MQFTENNKARRDDIDWMRWCDTSERVTSRGVAVAEFLVSIDCFEPDFRASIVDAIQRLCDVERRSQSCCCRGAHARLDLKSEAMKVRRGRLKRNSGRGAKTHRFDDSWSWILTKTLSLLPTHLLQEFVTLVRARDRSAYNTQKHDAIAQYTDTTKNKFNVLERRWWQT